MACVLIPFRREKERADNFLITASVSLLNVELIKKKSEIQYKGSQYRLWIAVLSLLISSLNVTDFLIVSLSSRNIYIPIRFALSL